MAPEVMHPAVVDPVTGDTDPFYIRTPTSLADDRHLVLKQGETFIVLDRRGDIRPVGLAQDGLYFRGTRFLSRLALRLGPHAPLLLSSSVKHDNALVAVDLTNPDIGGDAVTIPRGHAAPRADDRAVGRDAARAPARSQLFRRRHLDDDRLRLRR